MDFIPLSSFRKNKRSLSGVHNDRKPKRRMTCAVFPGDPRLLPRVKQYLETKQGNYMLDINLIAENLKQAFPEYRRKKNTAFKALLRKAIDHLEVSRSISKEPHNEALYQGISCDSSSENDNSITYEGFNMLNSSVASVYKKRTTDDFQQYKYDAYEAKKKSNISTFCDGQELNKTLINGPHLKPLSSSSEVPIPKRKEQIKHMEEAKKHAITSPPLVKKKKKEREIPLQQSTVTFADLGGIDKAIHDVCKLLVHMKHPEVYKQLGVIPPRGFLLHGPPGCGKTLLAHAIAGELELPFIKIAATEIISGVSGESETKIRDLFDRAVNSAPCILFIDEIDAITPKRETAQREMERRIVAQLLTCMDELNLKETTAHVMVIGATNHPDSLDSALRRAGRFDREICLGIPDLSSRKRILQILCRNLKLREQFDFQWLAQITPGYVGADLLALTREATVVAINRVFLILEQKAKDNFSTKTSEAVQLSTSHDSRTTCNVFETEDSKGIFSGQQLETTKQGTEAVNSIVGWLRDMPPLDEEQLKNLYIEKADFEEAIKVVQPSAKREGFATVPDVAWKDIGALKSIKEELYMTILAPVRYKKKFEELGLTTSLGILLCGPPGCGKTLLAKAVANESGINFISVKGPELLNMYVGESERAVRQCFQRAKNSSPCVIFFDEVDALCPRRSDLAECGSSSRVVNQLLTEMDGLEERKQVFVMGATNRPDIIDPAMLRPGRLDKVLFVGLPSSEDRVDILKAITKDGKKPPLGEKINLEDLGRDPRCEGFTGADLAALVREASISALRDYLRQHTEIPDDGKEQLEVNMRHFEAAFKSVKASVSSKDRDMYNKMKCSISVQKQ